MSRPFGVTPMGTGHVLGDGRMPAATRAGLGQLIGDDGDRAVPLSGPRRPCIGGRARALAGGSWVCSAPSVYRQPKGPVLVLDVGDFSIGTPPLSVGLPTQRRQKICAVSSCTRRRPACGRQPSTVQSRRCVFRLITPIECSTLARTLDLVRFFAARPHPLHRGGDSGDW